MWQPNSIQGQNQNQDQSEAVRAVFSDFCSNTTIHGIRYFVDRKRHWSERFWWIFVFVSSVCFCCISIRDIVIEWNENPVSMTLTEKPAPISAIPFPTITICPEIKARKERLNTTFEIKQLWIQHQRLMSDNQLKQLESLAHICNWAPGGTEYANESIYDSILEIAPDIDETISQCSWQSKRTGCAEFTPVITEKGLCFAFNALNSHEVFTKEMTPDLMIVKGNPNRSQWSLDDGYDNEADENSYPMRIFNSKPMGGLSIFLLLMKEDFGNVCDNLYRGFQVYLHAPGENARMSQLSLIIPPGEMALIPITATLVTTSAGLKNYSPNKRKCFFELERQLRFFKMYTQNNCEVECLANYTKQECGCVKFSMPRDNITRICGSSKIGCYRDAEDKLFGEDIIEGLKDPVARLFRIECNCLPACTTITYYGDVRSNNLDDFEPNSRWKISGGNIYFKSHELTTLKRLELYTFPNLLAICGGLLGLFLGVSALSITEFIYYFTLRMYWTVRRWKSRNIVAPFRRRIINSISNDIPSA